MNATQQTKITINRDMATRFVNAYFKTVYPHKNDVDYATLSYCDEFYEGCIKDEELRQLMAVLSDYQYLNIIQIIYNTIETLLCLDYDLGENIEYCKEYINIEGQSVLYLNAASKNYHLLNKIRNRHYSLNAWEQEDLTDMIFEANSCTICHSENITTPALKAFYYSTSFGLNAPVCSDCVFSDERKKKYEQKDPDYIPTSEEEEEGSSTHDEADTDDSEETRSNTETENDYKNGWKAGWKAAMHFVEKQTKQCHSAPDLPTCDNCGIECKAKKCGGSCNGCVKYCSVKCQTIHWKKTHKFACLNKKTL